MHDSPTLLCTEPDCDRPLRARGWCNMHYKRWSRAEGRTTPSPWNDRRRNNAQSRRARMKGARTGGSVFLADILERDGTQCWLCGKPVDMTLAWPHRDSKSVDCPRVEHTSPPTAALPTWDATPAKATEHTFDRRPETLPQGWGETPDPARSETRR